MRSFSLHHIGLHCHEKQSLTDFYEDVLGCKLVKSFILSSHLHKQIFSGKKDVEVFVYEHDQYRFEIFNCNEKHVPGCGHICIEVDNRNEFAQICEDKKIPVEWIKKDTKQLLFAKDFSGNLFEIKQRKK